MGGPIGAVACACSAGAGRVGLSRDACARCAPLLLFVAAGIMTVVVVVVVVPVVIVIADASGASPSARSATVAASNTRHIALLAQRVLPAGQVGIDVVLRRAEGIEQGRPRVGETTPCSHVCALRRAALQRGRKGDAAARVCRRTRRLRRTLGGGVDVRRIGKSLLRGTHSRLRSRRRHVQNGAQALDASAREDLDACGSTCRRRRNGCRGSIPGGLVARARQRRWPSMGCCVRVTSVTNHLPTNSLTGDETFSASLVRCLLAGGGCVLSVSLRFDLTSAVCPPPLLVWDVCICLAFRSRCYTLL